jgi:hypothetical protein
MLKVKETQNGFVKVGNGKTEFKRAAIKKLSFAKFKETFSGLKINHVEVYEALTGKKVAKTKAKTASERK